jgi:UDP-glucose 4-epimerase
LQAGHEVVVVDNLSNSSARALDRVQHLAGRPVEFFKVDLLDAPALEQIFARQSVEAVIHFAGLKAVGESVSKPLAYYHNNITGSLVLCQLMEKFGVRKLVFSSSATVYGNANPSPLTEDMPLSATSPYGRTKLMIEEILRDLHAADKRWNIALLRYFNPVGAHPSGRIGEAPGGIPNNLFPYISQVAVGKLRELSVFGSDYPTRDGTGVRDYIHVVDVALGHLKALEKLRSNPGDVAYNLGTGRGYSVLEAIAAFERAAGRKIPFKLVPRRPGDVATCFADSTKANRELGWQARLGLDQMCADTWRWQSNNPNGYE